VRIPDAGRFLSDSEPFILNNQRTPGGKYPIPAGRTSPRPGVTPGRPFATVTRNPETGGGAGNDSGIPGPGAVPDRER